VQTIAGPLAGDRVRIDVDVGRNAALELVGNAATLAYPSVDTARYELHVRVCTGGRIAWRPQPLILACGCKLESSIVLELAADATAFTREFVVLGRHGEQPGSYRSSFRCELEGRPLVHDAVRIDRGEVMSSSPAVLAGARAFASLALLGIVPNERIDPDELDLAGPGRVLRALAADAASLRARIEPAEAAYLRELATSSVV
jgi:urease accessory protein